MKCFTLSSRVDLSLVRDHEFNRSALYPKPYPAARVGIVLHDFSRTVAIGPYIRVAVSEELLKLANKPDHIVRNGARITVLRASVENKDGKPILVPEKQGDELNALAALELSGAPFLSIRYAADDEQVVAKQAAGMGELDDQLLAALKPFKQLIARRYDRRYALWGAERLRETLSIKYDGTTIFYDPTRHST